MEYQKYLKYKTKYLQLKAKLTQLGGALIWVTDVKPITPSESEYIQQQYSERNTSEFTIPPPHSRQEYRYRLNIDKDTGERINIESNTVNIENKDGSGWKVNVTPITPSESEYIQQQYSDRNTSKFTIPDSHSRQGYTYRLNIDKGKGERINIKGNKVKIIQINTSAMVSPAISSSAMVSPRATSSPREALPPGGRVREMKFNEYSEARFMPQEQASKPKLSYSLQEAKEIIKKYVKKFKSNKSVNATELAEITAANNTVDKEETDQEKKLAVKYLYEYAVQFHSNNFIIANEDWFQHTLEVLSNY